MRVLVTGCSSGFGELIVKTLAADGHAVFATMRDPAARNRVAAERLTGWAAERGRSLEVLDLDVASDSSANAALEHALASGPLDVVVNNAGIAAAGPLEAFSSEQMEHMFNINVLGPMRVNRAVLPSMRARGSGLIVWVTSTLGRVLPRRGGLYPATKWAAEGVAESLHYDVKDFGVDLVILEPGAFPTPSTANAMLAAHQDVVEAYRAVRAPQPSPRVDRTRFPAPNPQVVADEVQRLVALPPGQRPMRAVVGPVFTEGVAAYNQAYEAMRDHLAAVLRREDQVVTWGRAAPSSSR